MSVLTLRKTKSFSLFCFLVLFFSFVSAQTDSEINVDSLLETLKEPENDDFLYEEERNAEPFTEVSTERVAITLRTFDENELKQIKEDKSFGYLETKKAKSPNFLQLLIMKLSEWINSKMDRNRDTERKVQNWLVNALVYGIALFAVIMILWSLFKVKIREIFLKEAQPLEISFREAEINITETNFEVLIQNALRQADYRGAVRLLYLEALKSLTQNNWIQWKSNKTNHEYLMELYNSPFRKSFVELTRNFEYIFYGDFPVNAEVYHEIAGVFKEFQAKLTKKLS